MFCRARTCVYWCLLVCGMTNMSHTSSNSRALLVGFFKNAALALSVFSSVACLLSALSLLRPIGEPFKDRTAATWHVHCGPFKPPFPLRNVLFAPLPPLTLHSHSLSLTVGEILFLYGRFSPVCVHLNRAVRSLARSHVRSFIASAACHCSARAELRLFLLCVIIKKFAKSCLRCRAACMSATERAISAFSF